MCDKSKVLLKWVFSTHVPEPPARVAFLLAASAGAPGVAAGCAVGPLMELMELETVEAMVVVAGPRW